MYRVTRGIQATGCTQFFHDNYHTEAEVQRAVDSLLKRDLKTIKVRKITEEDVTAQFLKNEGRFSQ